MRYFSNFLEDRRFFTSVGGSSNRYELLKLSRTNKEVTASTTSTTPNTTPSTTNTGTSDLFTGSNKNKIYQSTVHGNTTEWIGAGASSFDASYSDLSPEMRAHIDKFGETPTYVGDDGKVHVDREALTQRVADYYAGPEGGSMNLDGFSVQGFMAADNDGRMSMLKSMREQNNAYKAAKFEEDMRLAQERDAAKKFNTNTQQAQNGTTNTMNTVMSAVMQGIKLFGQASAAA